MGIRSIPGPVFLCEALAASRKRLGYVLRAILVLAMLVAMWVAWLGLRERVPLDPASMTRFLAELGEKVYYGIAGVQLSLVLLSAPAATAGSVCVDRARGWLAHMFVTPLSDAEIVLGKLAVGLALGHGPRPRRTAGTGHLHAPRGSHPRGASDPDSRVAGCLRPGLHTGLRPLGAGLDDPRGADARLRGLGRLAARGAVLDGGGTLGGIYRPPGWFLKLNPFVLVYAPYAWPGYVMPSDVAIFVAVCLAIAAGALALSILHLRREIPARASDRAGWRPCDGRPGCISSPGGRARRLTATPSSGASGTATGRREWAGW